MKAYPHIYHVAAKAAPEGEVLLSSAGLEELHSSPPAEFDGPGDRWSPETLLTAAIIDCFILTFRAIARAGKLPWISLDCDIEGTLERDQGVSRFTGFRINARLGVPAGTDVEAAERAMHKAEAGCLISNSLAAHPELTATVAIIA
jgi:organic hydroperoxide reductase OsmC/OhrA